jgi:hypothetical protein
LGRVDGSQLTESNSNRHVGLHFCRNYQNVVRYNPELCGKCPFCSFNERGKEGLSPGHSTRGK